MSSRSYVGGGGWLAELAELAELAVLPGLDIFGERGLGRDWQIGKGLEIGLLCWSWVRDWEKRVGVFE